MIVSADSGRTKIHPKDNYSGTPLRLTHIQRNRLSGHSQPGSNYDCVLYRCTPSRRPSRHLILNPPWPSLSSSPSSSSSPPPPPGAWSSAPSSRRPAAGYRAAARRRPPTWSKIRGGPHCHSSSPRSRGYGGYHPIGTGHDARAQMRVTQESHNQFCRE